MEGGGGANWGWQIDVMMATIVITVVELFEN